MGMDVYGIAPRSKKGEYFRNNVWWWHPLADYCIETNTPLPKGKSAAAICKGCTKWHTNDGDGLDDKQSVALADALQIEVNSGRCGGYANRYNARLAALSDEVCSYCSGSGIRTDAVGVKNGFPDMIVPVPGPGDRSNNRAGQTGWCNACGGRGSVRPAECRYLFSVENVQNWIHFLYDCGGFKIC